MNKRWKRITIVLTGCLLVAGSLIWIKHCSDDVILIPAITFSAGLIAVLGTAKRALLHLSKKTKAYNADRSK